MPPPEFCHAHNGGPFGQALHSYPIHANYPMRMPAPIPFFSKHDNQPPHRSCKYYCCNPRNAQDVAMSVFRCAAFILSIALFGVSLLIMTVLRTEETPAAMGKYMICVVRAPAAAAGRVLTSAEPALYRLYERAAVRPEPELQQVPPLAPVDVSMPRPAPAARC